MGIHLHSFLTVLMLFFFAPISPGPNFLVVMQTTLSFGKVAGFLTALGATLGGAIYGSFGLFGITRFIAVRPAMACIEFLGGLYLVWLGRGMFVHPPVGAVARSSHSAESVSPQSHFWHGLATDLTNPKTIVFFASIFAVSLIPQSPRTLRGAMLVGIVLTPVLWRSFLPIVFSTSAIRSVYERTGQIVERVFGAALCVFGLLLVDGTIS